MCRSFKIAALCLLVGPLSGCISSPTSEVMVDTNAKTKKALPGEPENVLPASTLVEPPGGSGKFP
jgi:hypothetical protein